ncbi:Kelch repeat-containing protein [[Eubacterium] cellulosolvens]
MGLLIFAESLAFVPCVIAGSYWVEESDTDFINGSLDNVDIIGTGPAAVLRLNITGNATNETLNWVNKMPSNAPAQRHNHSMAGVFGTDKVVMFGGEDNSSKNLNDTWVYTLGNNTWINTTKLIKPPYGIGQAMAAVYGTNDVVLFYGSFNNDTWVYNLTTNNWTKKLSGVGPDIGVGHAMASIYGTDKVLLYIAETWVYDLGANNWSKITTASTPNVGYPAMAGVYNDDKVVLFGGNNMGWHDETWVFDLSAKTWTKKAPAVKPGPREKHRMATIEGTDKVLMFGGHKSGIKYNDTWVYDLSDDKWTEIKPTTSPSGRHNHGLVTVNAMKKLVLFGGRDGYIGNAMNDTWLINYGNISSRSGTYISAPYDLGANSTFGSIDCGAYEPSNTHIKVQLRTAGSNSSLATKNFVGPGGSTETYYTTSPAFIWSGHDGDRWVQYKAYFTSTSSNRPDLDNVTLEFNNLPLTTLNSPPNSNASTDNKPTFAWTYTDSESEVQTGFQVVIDDDSNFGTIDYDSTPQNSGNKNWQFPTGTGYSTIADGKWYWKARTRDEDGDWGENSSAFNFVIDTKPPTSSFTSPANNSALNSLNAITGTAADPVNGTGVTKVEILIERLSDSKLWDGATWVDTEKWLGVVGTTSWAYNSNSVTWTSGSQYRIRSRAVDGVANSEITSWGNKFTIDLDKPISTISSPVHDAILNELDVISGTGADTGGAGLKLVEVCIHRTDDDKYWSGVNWVGAETWCGAIGTSNWLYYVETVTWSSGSIYILRSRAWDMVDNVESPSSGHHLFFDLDKPVSTIENIIDNSFLNSLDTISGNSTDAGSAGLEKVEISIYRTSDMNYWDGANWTTDIQWLEAAGKDQWAYDSSAVEWTTDTNYRIYSQATDNAGNIEHTGPGVTFMFDNIPPTELSLAINRGEEYTAKTALTLFINAEDSGSGVYQMAISTNNAMWSAWEPFVNTKEFTLHPQEGEKAIYLKVKDRAENIVGPVFDTIVLDLSPPEKLVISINNNSQFTNEKLVTLTLEASDKYSGVSDMAFSTDGTDWSPWENFDNSKAFILPSGVGEKIVYFRAQDNMGNVAEPVFDKIILDTAAPEQVAIVINNDDEFTNSESVSLALQAVDILSGVNEMAFSFDKITWTQFEKFETEKTIDLTTGDGKKYIYFKVSDYAGNVGVIVSDSIILDTTPPHSLAISINDDASVTSSNEVTLQISAVDDTSGVQLMAFSTDGNTWSSWEAFTSERLFTLPPADGEKTVYFRVMDTAGNIAEPVQATIILDTSGAPPIEEDSDDDGVPDDIDAFPDDAAAAVDSDNDNYPDYWNIGKNENDSSTNLHIDKFPDDIAASIDTDGDKYPDKWNPGKSKKDSTTGLELDEYPDNPYKHKKDTVISKPDIMSSLLFIVLLIIIIVLIIGITSAIIVRNRRQRLGEPYSKDKTLRELRNEIIEGTNPEAYELIDYQIQTKLEERLRRGDISEDTYEFIKKYK